MERQFREILSNKVSGTTTGLWLLIPEHLKLGTWDLLGKMSHSQDDTQLKRKLGLQVIHESAMCNTRIRKSNTICHQGFDILNGLPFIASDVQIHNLLSEHSLEQSRELQIALGKLRQIKGDYRGNLIAMDPHRIVSYTERISPKKKIKRNERAKKMLQTFFAIDSQTGQPIGFDIGFSSNTVSNGTKNLVKQIKEIIPACNNPLILSDAEHYTEELLNLFALDNSLDILVPAPRNQRIVKYFNKLEYKEYWPGYYIGTSSFRFGDDRSIPEQLLIVQRQGLKQTEFEYKAFISTRKENVVEMLTTEFPTRWTIEEYFKYEGSLGWNKALTQNLNIRYGKMSLCLITQYLINQLRKILPEDYRKYEVKHLSDEMFHKFNGDLRVKDDKIIVTLYGIPEKFGLRTHYENLPQKLESENINPRVPWLYNYKVDFHFK